MPTPRMAMCIWNCCTSRQDGAIAETTNGSLLLAVPADTHADLERAALTETFSRSCR